MQRKEFYCRILNRFCTNSPRLECGGGILNSPCDHAVNNVMNRAAGELVSGQEIIVNIPQPDTYEVIFTNKREERRKVGVVKGTPYDLTNK